MANTSFFHLHHRQPRCFCLGRCTRLCFKFIKTVEGKSKPLQMPPPDSPASHRYLLMGRVENRGKGNYRLQSSKICQTSQMRDKVSLKKGPFYRGVPGAGEALVSGFCHSKLSGTMPAVGKSVTATTTIPGKNASSLFLRTTASYSAC